MNILHLALSSISSHRVNNNNKHPSPPCIFFFFFCMDTKSDNTKKIISPIQKRWKQAPRLAPWWISRPGNCIHYGRKWSALVSATTLYLEQRVRRFAVRGGKMRREGATVESSFLPSEKMSGSGPLPLPPAVWRTTVASRESVSISTLLLPSSCHRLVLEELCTYSSSDAYCIYMTYTYKKKKPDCLFTF